MSRYTLFNRIYHKVMAVLLVLTLLVSVAPAASAAELSGSCGGDLTWELQGDTLVISGSGAMKDYPEQMMAPWYPIRDRIAAVQLPEGLTRIGDLAFYGCENLTSVVIPDSVTEIGWHAFDGCTNLSMLTMSRNIRVIETSAFEDCYDLRAVYLPETLAHLGDNAFYRCQSLSTVTIPSSVTYMGVSAFAYCYELVFADVQAQIESLPSWTFYGCYKLANVVLSAGIEGTDLNAFGKCNGLDHVQYTGSKENAGQIEDNIDRDAGGISDADVTDTPVEDTTGGTTYEETEDGDVKKESEVTQTENSTITGENVTTYPEGSTETNITVTIENENGWKEAEDYLEEKLENEDSAQVEIFIKDDSQVPADVLKPLAGKDILVKVHTASGTIWEFNCKDISVGEHGFACQRLNATEEQLMLMNCRMGYQLCFLYDAQINAEVMIRLPVQHAKSTATLCQVVDDELTKLQSVVVDNNGFAHFYLGAVDTETIYLIGIDMPDIAREEVLIPQNLHNDYGITEQIRDVDYVITGRKSSWGIGFLEVNKILIGFMLSTAAIVGLVMYSLNKRKLRRGVMPGWEDDEDDEN